MFRSFAFHADGESHVRLNKPCQDYSENYDGNGYHIVAIADGHGGAKYFRSDVGARIACTIGIRCIKSCMSKKTFTNKFINHEITEDEKEQAIVQLEEAIISQWGESIRKDKEKNPFIDDELVVFDEAEREFVKNDFNYAAKAYGTTLLLGVICDDFWFGIHIGDGTFVTITETFEFKQPISLDERCVGNYVTSICDSNAIKYFHHNWGIEPLRAIILATDGIDESFKSEQSFYDFYRKVVENAVLDFDGTVRDLEEYLPTLSKMGSRDDVSIAGVVRIDAQAV